MLPFAGAIAMAQREQPDLIVLDGGRGQLNAAREVLFEYNLAIPAIALHVTTVLTNTTPIGVTRGPGFAEMVNIMERLIDAAARQCGFDRIELRRHNFASSMPMTNALGSCVDSGDFAGSSGSSLSHTTLASNWRPTSGPLCAGAIMSPRLMSSSSASVSVTDIGAIASWSGPSNVSMLSTRERCPEGYATIASF